MDDDGCSYYVLTEGSYTDVTVGTDDEGNSLIAASITVKAATDDVQIDLGGQTMTYSGLHTQIKWYFPEKEGGNYLLTVTYKALVDLEVGGLSYTIGNVVWMNDRPGSRIYDSIWGGGTIIDFEKQIVTTEGAVPQEDTLTDYSIIGPGDTVTYRLALHNTNDGTFILNGSKLADVLPETFDVFEWAKDVNVTNLQIKTEGEGITMTGLEEWSIGDSYGGILGERQYILWPETTSITFTEPSTVYLYFTLTYPKDAEEADLWNQYTAGAGGSPIDNTLYVYRFPSTVTHDLKETGRVLLQKGVYGMYHYINANNQYYNKAGNSRYYYNNQDSRNRAVAYYVTIYNSGNKRLYLNDLQDQLPDGFTFKHLAENGNIEAIPTGQEKRTITTKGGYAPFGNYPLTEMGSGGILYRSATVTGTATENGVTFAIGEGTGTYSVPYDDARGQCYLNKNEAIVFAYTCNIGASTETEDSATNVIAMPYSDYLDTGLTVIDKNELFITAAPSDYFGDSNDGTRQLKSSQQVSQEYGLSGSEKNWLVSEVTVIRGGIVPGVTKDTVSYYDTNTGVTTPYTNSVNPQSNYLVTWNVRLHNSGTLSLTNYTFTDIMPAPYVFEGNVTFTIYDSWGSEMFQGVLLTFPTRTGEEESLPVKNSDGKELTVPFDGTKVDIGVDRELQMSMHRVNGNEVLTLYCVDANLSIPEGGYVKVSLSSRNPTTTYQNAVYINRATLVPEVQEFVNVGQGSLIRDENGNPVGAENSSPVTVSFGFSTSSWKQVTETENTDNTVLSTDTGNRRIVLDSENSTFTYTLTVNNDTDKAMTKLVLIDNLAQEGDHSPFNTEVKRNSEFTVELVGVPQVTITNADGTASKLDEQYYTVAYSSTTDFGGPQSNDWKGEVTGTNAAWSPVQNDVRAIRVVILDDSGTQIPAKSSVAVSFEAKVGADAAPGEVAWNSFGYHYALQGVVTGELEAMPLTVGVSIPGVPSLEKRLVDNQGQAFAAEQDEYFGFLIYRGEALDEKYDSKETLLNALTEANIEYREITVMVPAGQDQSEAIRLEELGWEWSVGSKYTIVELSMSDSYKFSRFIGGERESLTFAYDPANNQTIICENKMREWSTAMIKTDQSGNPLSGAVFALYSPESKEQLVVIPQKYASLDIQKVIEADGIVWYLKNIATTDESGTLDWTGLLQEKYYLLEIKAPDGYCMAEAGRTLYQSDCEGGINSLHVINYTLYALPETGSSGTRWYTTVGMLLIIFGGMCRLYLHERKRRKENT